MQIEPKTFPNSIAFTLFGMVLLFAFFTPITYGQDKLDHESVRNYYSYWKAKYIKPSKRVKGGSFVDFEAKGSTCSEAQGYGMLITVYLSESKQEFESLNLFRQQFKSNIDARLMAWKIDDKKATPVDTTCATDGDLDIAYALILASEKWKAPEYLKQARTILTGIEESLVRSDFSLRRGDWDTQQHSTRLSDFMPSHFATFARASNPEI